MWARRLGALVVAALSVVLIQTPAQAGPVFGSGGVLAGLETDIWTAGICNSDWIWAPNSPITFDASCSYMRPAGPWLFEWDFNFHGPGTFHTSTYAGTDQPVTGMTVTKADGFATMTQDFAGVPTLVTHTVAVRLTDLATGVTSEAWFNVDVGPLPWPQPAPVAKICNTNPLVSPTNVPIVFDGSCSSYDLSHRLRFDWDFNYNGTEFNATNDVFGFPVSGLRVTKPDGYKGTTPVSQVAFRVWDLSTHLSSVAVISVNVSESTAATPVPPVARAGGPYLGVVNSPVQLDASSSSDTEGDPLTYAWDFNNDGVFDDATGATPAFTSAVPGTFPIAVQVTDHPDQNATPYNAASQSTVAYTTVEVGAHAPHAFVSGPYSAFAGDTVALDASGSFDVDGLPLTYAWDFGGGNFTDGTGSTIDFPVAADAAPGTSYTVCVKVSNSARSATACTSVNVVAPLVAPVVTLTRSAVTIPTSASDTPVQLDASRSFDGNGNSAALSFAWTSADGGSFSDATSAITNFVVPAHTPAGTTFHPCVEAGVLSVPANPTATACVTITVTGDRIAPVLTLPDPITVEATGAAGAVVTYSASALDAVDGSVPVQCTPVSGATFALGSKLVTCSATDSDNNTAQASFTVTVKDTTGPVVSVPSDRTVEATGPSGAAVTYSASALDAVDGSVPVQCTPVSGATFALGSKLVTCSATDSQNNTAQASFTVTVKDTTPPTLTPTASIVVPATSASGASVTFLRPTANDLVDGTLLVTCDRASGSIFPIGTTTVHCLASDTRGNTGTSSFTVRVDGAATQLSQLLAQVPDTRRLAELRTSITRAIATVNGQRAGSICSALSQIAEQLREAQGNGLTRAQVQSLLADLGRIQTSYGCRR